MRNNICLCTLARGKEGAYRPLFFPSILTLSAATGTGWSTSVCWRGAASTASGTSRSAPSTGWWTSTEPTASPWRKWSASGTLAHPLARWPILDATRTPTRIKVTLKSPSTRPTSAPRVCSNQYDPSWPPHSHLSPWQSACLMSRLCSFSV